MDNKQDFKNKPTLDEVIADAIKRCSKETNSSEDSGDELEKLKKYEKEKEY